MAGPWNKKDVFIVQMFKTEKENVFQSKGIGEITAKEEFLIFWEENTEVPLNPAKGKKNKSRVGIVSA